MRWLLVAALMAGLIAPAQAADRKYDTPSGAKLPRWAMLGRDEVNARNGPSLDNRKLWRYKKAGIPVQIISETREWRLICDPGGGVAWVKRSMLRPSARVITSARKLDLLAEPKSDARVKAIVRPQSVAQLETCKQDWCQISVGGQKGWVPQNLLWGTQETPVCQRPDMLAGQ